MSRPRLLCSCGSCEMNIYVSLSSLTSRCNATCCNATVTSITSTPLRSAELKRRDSRGKTNIHLKVISRSVSFVFFLGRRSARESFAGRNFITAQEETRHQMRRFWPTSARPRALSNETEHYADGWWLRSRVYELHCYIKLHHVKCGLCVTHLHVCRRRCGPRPSH